MTQIQAGVPKNLGLIFEDAFGNKTTPDGIPDWSATGLGGLAVAADGLTAIFTNSGKVESGQISVTGDLAKGAEVVPFVATLDYTVIPGNAVTVRLEVLPDPAPVPTPTPEPAPTPTPEPA